MVLTIEKVLGEIEIFSSAKVISGERGLNKIVSWIHISEHKNIVDWIKPGTLLLSSGYIIKDNPELFAQKIPKLIQKGLSGLVITVGSHIKEIPKIIIGVSNNCNFPIISLSSTIPLMDVTLEIHKKIISLNNEFIENNFNINKMLNKIVIDAGDLTELANEIKNLIKRSITIEDPDLNLLAYANYRNTDQLREQTIKERKTPQKLVDYLNTKGYLKLIKTSNKVIKIPIIPEIGSVKERIVAPILVGSHLYGYFWIIADDRPLNELDYIVIERASLIASLILSRDEAIHKAKQEAFIKIFDNLVDPFGNNDPYFTSKRLSILGVINYYQVMIVEHELHEFRRTHRLFMIIKEVLCEEGSLVRILEKGNRFIVLLRGEKNFDNEMIANMVLKATSERGYKVKIGLSNRTNQSTLFLQHYQQAIDACRIGNALPDNYGKVWSYEKLGLLSYLLNIPSEIRSENTFFNLVESIASYDVNHGTDYFNTIEVYLDNKFNSVEAAKKLNIHRNTLSQRLEKMARKWKVDFDDSYFLLNLHVSIKEWHILKKR